MPTLRILADGTWLFASPGQPDLDGLPVFMTGSADTVNLTFDFTAWLQGATISASTWTATNATITSSSYTSTAATALLTMPTVVFPVIPDPAYPQPVTMRNTCTASDGRVIHISARLLAQPR